MDWKDTIVEVLEGATFGEMQHERLGWNGVSSLYALFLESTTEEQIEMLISIRALIEKALKTNTEQDWRFAADLIYLSSFLGNTTEILDPTISRLRRHLLDEAMQGDVREALSHAIRVYAAANSQNRPSPSFREEDRREDLHSSNHLERDDNVE